MNEADPKSARSRTSSRVTREKVRIPETSLKQVKRRFAKRFLRWKYYMIVAAASVGLAVMVWLLLGKIIKPPPLE